jgi:hypothetical protein
MAWRDAKWYRLAMAGSRPGLSSPRGHHSMLSECVFTLGDFHSMTADADVSDHGINLLHLAK